MTHDTTATLIGEVHELRVENEALKAGLRLFLGMETTTYYGDFTLRDGTHADRVAIARVPTDEDRAYYKGLVA